MIERILETLLFPEDIANQAQHDAFTSLIANLSIDGERVLKVVDGVVEPSQAVMCPTEIVPGNTFTSAIADPPSNGQGVLRVSDGLIEPLKLNVCLGQTSKRPVLGLPILDVSRSGEADVLSCDQIRPEGTQDEEVDQNQWQLPGNSVPSMAAE